MHQSASAGTISVGEAPDGVLGVEALAELGRDPGDEGARSPARSISSCVRRRLVTSRK